MPPLVQGLIVGFAIAAPVGPVGLLCIRRSLADGRLAGFVSGLGAATADALYGVIAALGLTAVTDALLAHRTWLQLGGGLFLLWIGVTTLRARPPAQAAAARPAPNLRAAYASTFVLTFANPMTVLAFLGIFAGLAPAGTGGSTAGAVLLVAGVFAGSACWWAILSTTAGAFGRRLEHGGLRTVNLVSGSVIAVFGAWQLWQLV